MDAGQGFPQLPEFGGQTALEVGQWKYVVGTYLNVSLGDTAPQSIALCESADGTRLVSFGGGAWHGEWHACFAPLQLDLSFDCRARRTHLKRARLIKDAGAGEHKWTGNDYQGRLIIVQWQAAWLHVNQTDGWQCLWQSPSSGLLDSYVVRKRPDLEST